MAEKTIYEKRCDELIAEYGLTRSGFIDSVQIHNIILELFQKKCLGKRIVLWGAGYHNSLTSHASILLTKYATCLQGVVCLTDSCKELQGKQFMGFPIIAPEELPDWNVDVVIISSRSSAESIKKSLYAVLPSCESIDIYQELRNRGIDIPYNFYEERNFYTEIYNVRMEYEHADEAAKPEALRKLIASYLHIKDFYYAFHFIEEYAAGKFSGYEGLLSFQRKMQALLQEVGAANARRRDDINIHYIDALRAVDVFGKDGSYKVLREYLEESVVLTNIHSTAPTTYESVYSITTGELPYTENVYENRFIFQPEEFGVMKEAIEKGYQINLYASAEWRIIHENEKVHYTDQIHMTDKLWKMACDNAVSHVPCFNYLYYPWELHFPLLCGYHRNKPVAMGFKDVGIVDMSDFIEEQHLDCLDYVDKEMAFYKGIMPDNGYTILFSDHSQIVYDKEKCVPFFCYYQNPERSTHCVMAIKGPDIEPEEENVLLSMLDFNQIVKEFLWGDKKRLPKREVIQYQYYSVHNKQFRDVAKEKGYTDYIDGIRCYMSEKFIYVVTKTGKEEVYRIDTPKDNIIATQEGKRYADGIRKRFDRSFPDFLEMHY